MMTGKWREETADEAKERLLEETATALLRGAGAFRRGTGIRSPRSEGEAGAGVARWEEWMTRRVREFFSTAGEDLDALAEVLRLTPDQKAALGHHRLEELTLAETAAVMGTRIWRVRMLLVQADRKCRLHRHEPPVSARALYWQEIRQKQASVYRRPFKARSLSKKEYRKLTQRGRRSTRGAPLDWS